MSNRTTHPPSVAFAIPAARPEACGVTDYSIRMATHLEKLGVRSAILSVEWPRAEREWVHRTGEGPVTLLPLTPDTAKQFDITAIQFVANFSPAGVEFCKFFERNAIRTHLMIHEFWRLSTPGAPLPLRSRLNALRQRYQLKRLIRKAGPASIATSNPHYAEILAEAGISCTVSPMPGTIPLSPTRAQANDEASLTPRPVHWVTLGNLYLEDWDCAPYFEKVRQYEVTTGRPHRWTICGKQSEDSIRKLTEIAGRVGFDRDRFHFTGPLSADEIDAQFSTADASFGCSDILYWEKSTGILAVVERGIPTYLPRNILNAQSQVESGLFVDFKDFTRALETPKSLRKPYFGVHSAPVAAERFLESLQIAVSGSPHDPEA